MKPLSRHWKVIWLSALFSVLYWIIASAFEAFILHNRPIFECMFNPPPHDLFLRLLAFCFIAVVSFFINYRLSRSEHASAEKDHFLEDVFSSIQDGVSVLDTEMRIIRVNPQMEKWYAHARPLAGKKCYEAYHNRSERCEVCPSWKTIQTGKASYEVVPKTGEGGVIVGWLDLYSFPLFDTKTNKLAGVIEYVRDITPRRQAEEASRELNETLKTLVYASPLAIISIDNQCKVKFWGAAAENIFGWKENEIIGQRIPIMPHEKCFEFNEMQKNSRENSSHKGIEMVCLRKDGSQIVVEGWTSKLKGHYNEVAAIWLFADITERKNMELALIESEKKYRGLFEELRDVIYLSTLDGKFLDINDAGVKLLGYSSKEEIFDLNMEQDVYAYPEHRKKLMELLNEKLFVDGFEAILKKKNGEHVIVQLNVKAQKNKDGSLKLIRGIIRDITDKKKLEQKLLHAQKMEAIGQLAEGIAHDFNNILTAVIGYANLLKMKMKEDDSLHTYVDAVLSTSERGAALTNGLLTFGRKQTVDLAPVNLNSIIERTGKLLLRLIGEDVELKIVLADKDINVMANSLQLEQVLMNLATNARDAMPNGGMLMIEAWQEEIDRDYVRQYPYMIPGKYALISFADTGAGFDETTKAKIFEPFFTTKEVGKGTGLGLAIVYGIIKQHNGYINVYSELGKGTTFKIYLPIAEMQKTEDTQHENLKASVCSGGVILLGEDDKMVRNIIKSIFEEFKYRVIEASNGEEVLNKFNENKDIVDLLVLDLIMPKKNGKEVFDEIKKIKPGVKVIFASGYTTDLINKDEALKEGYSFIPKPIAPDELLKLAEKILAGKA